MKKITKVMLKVSFPTERANANEFFTALNLVMQSLYPQVARVIIESYQEHIVKAPCTANPLKESRAWGCMRTSAMWGGVIGGDADPSGRDISRRSGRGVMSRRVISGHTGDSKGTEWVRHRENERLPLTETVPCCAHFFRHTQMLFLISGSLLKHIRFQYLLSTPLLKHGIRVPIS